MAQALRVQLYAAGALSAQAYGNLPLARLCLSEALSCAGLVFDALSDRLGDGTGDDGDDDDDDDEDAAAQGSLSLASVEAARGFAMLSTCFKSSSWRRSVHYLRIASGLLGRASALPLSGAASATGAPFVLKDAFAALSLNDSGMCPSHRMLTAGPAVAAAIATPQPHTSPLISPFDPEPGVRIALLEPDPPAATATATIVAAPATDTSGVPSAASPHLVPSHPTARDDIKRGSPIVDLPESPSPSSPPNGATTSAASSASPSVSGSPPFPSVTSVTAPTSPPEAFDPLGAPSITAGSGGPAAARATWFSTVSAALATSPLTAFLRCARFVPTASLTPLQRLYEFCDFHHMKTLFTRALVNQCRARQQRKLAECPTLARRCRHCCASLAYYHEQTPGGSGGSGGAGVGVGGGSAAGTAAPPAAIMPAELAPWQVQASLGGFDHPVSFRLGINVVVWNVITRTFFVRCNNPLESDILGPAVRFDPFCPGTCGHHDGSVGSEAATAAATHGRNEEDGPLLFAWPARNAKPCPQLPSSFLPSRVRRGRDAHFHWRLRQTRPLRHFHNSSSAASGARTITVGRRWHQQ